MSSDRRLNVRSITGSFPQPRVTCPDSLAIRLLPPFLKHRFCPPDWRVLQVGLASEKGKTAPRIDLRPSVAGAGFSLCSPPHVPFWG
jgi:hypothetical protein